MKKIFFFSATLLLTVINAVSQQIKTKQINTNYSSDLKTEPPPADNKRTKAQESVTVTPGAFGLRKSHSFDGCRLTSKIDPRILTNGYSNMLSYDREKVVGEQIVHGIITDMNGVALQNVSVKVVGSRASTGTDSLGRYRILANTGPGVLLFETANMWPCREALAGRTQVDIALPVSAPGIRELRNATDDEE